jgi:hypothetical protein
MAIKINGDNSVANPGFTGDDTDTGLQVGTDELNLVTGGTARATVDSSGRVGIATTTPGNFDAGADDLVVGSGSGDSGITIYSGTSNLSNLYFADGTSGSAQYAGGMNYSHSTNALSFFTNDGTTRMSIDSSGRVGIGETSMDALLVIKGDSDANTTPSIRLKDGTDTREAWITNTAGDLILNNGGDDNVPHCYLKLFDGNVMAFATANTERMRIDSSGNVLVGKTTASTGTDGIALGAGGLFTATRSDSFPGIFNREGSTGSVIEIKSNDSTKGNISVSASAVQYNTTSDYRLKENVVNIADGITRVKQLAPKRFNFIADAETTVDGFLAHEAQAVVPEAITGTHNEVDENGDPVYQGIDQSKLVPLLTAALQEAIAKIETLETQNADLTARITALETA